MFIIYLYLNIDPIICLDQSLHSSQVAVLKTDGKTLETGAWPGAGSGSEPQKIVTFHVSENGDTLVQEAFEAATGAVEQEETTDVSQEVTQIGIGAYEGADFSVVEQATDETAHRYYRASKTTTVMPISVI